VVPLDENRIAPKRIAPNDLNSDPAIHDILGVPNGCVINLIRQTDSAMSPDINTILCLSYFCMLDTGSEEYPQIT
jgi:hypothetical protein